MKGPLHVGEVAYIAGGATLQQTQNLREATLRL
jgi:hypothetical protein